MDELNFHWLALFRAVARHGGVGAAADALAISQPSVSAQVRQLARALGLTLLERSGRGVRLTDQGQRVLAYAERIFTLADDLQREAADLRAGVAGRLVVGASTTVGEYVLPAVLGHFHQQWPGVEILAQVGNSATVEARLLAGEWDLGLVGEPLEHPTLEASQFATDTIVLIASPEHRLAGRRVEPQELAGEAFVSREPGSATRKAAEAALQVAGVAPRAVMELGSNDAVKRAVAAGLGLGALSDRAVAPELAAGWLARLDAPWFQCRRPLVLLRHRDRLLTRPEQAFIALLRQV
jgi:DNA-binding transcriptional LysR family regulator